MTARTKNRSRLARLGVLALALCVSAGLATGAAGAKKKGKKGPGSVNITKAVNLPVPDETPGAPGIDGILTSTIPVGKEFKGRKVRDVNVTLQTVGTLNDPGPGPDVNAVADLTIRLQAPNGATSLLWFNDGGGTLLGPVTFDDESNITEVSGGTMPDDPTTLFSPFQGRLQPQCGGCLNGSKPLSVLDNGGVPGNWNLVIRDDDTFNINTLTSWTLNVVVGRPFRTK